MSQQPAADKRKTKVILWINGKPGNCKLIKIEPNNEIKAATNTDKEVAFFQKRATRKITTIPGEKYPVKFCMYWKIDSKLPNNGWATKEAITRETITVNLPTFIRFFCGISPPLKYL